MTPRRRGASRAVLYNEVDPFVAVWLENLIARKLIAPGLVDRRSIRDLYANDLLGFTQVHFFAGIGGWSHALRLAGWPDDREVWTGSAPCQPFSAAGNRKGTNDDRHLWPAWFQLIRERRPATVFGEQVASPAGLVWFDSVRADLEAEGYAVAAADLCALAVGAPHRRQRVFFVADADGGQPRNGDAQRCREHGQQSGDGPAPEGAWDDVDWITCSDGKVRPIGRRVLPLVDGLPRRLDRLRAYGNAIVPQVAARFVKSYMEARGIVGDAGVRPSSVVVRPDAGRPASAQSGAPDPNAVGGAPDITAWLNKITCGDAVTVMNQMPPESVGLVVCSPPYNLRNSSGNGMRGGGGGRWKSAQLLSGYDTHGDCMPHEEYVAWQRDCVTAMLRVLRPDGAIFYNHKARVQRGLLWDPSEILAGFPVRQRIVWQRSGGLNFNDSFFLPTHELVYVICKSRAFQLAPKASGLGDVWRIPQERNSDHPAPFPVELARRCIGSTTANVILDPFLGSGTTAVAAEELKRDWVGIEISESYCEAARRRIEGARSLVTTAKTEVAPAEPPHASRRPHTGVEEPLSRASRAEDPNQVNGVRPDEGGMEDLMAKKKSTNAPDARWVRIDELIVDPELLKMIPRPSQADRDALLESLRAGQQLAIMVTIDLRVLDGYTRLELLKELGVEFVLVQVVEGLDTRDAELDYCININLHRRHLLDIQRVELGRARLEVHARREAAERGREGAKAGGRKSGRGRGKPPGSSPNAGRDPGRHDREASAIVAKGVGLKSGRQFEKGVAVLDGPPELAEMVRDGRMTINAAHGKIRAAAKQAAAAERVAQVNEASLGGEVILGDGLAVKLPPASAALVIVDLPYGITKSGGLTVRGDMLSGVGDVLPEWDQVDSRTTIRASVKRIAELLAPTGSFYIFCDRVLVTFAWEELLAAGLVPRNTLYWVKSNPVPSGRRNWSSAVEAIVYGVKGKTFTWNLTGDAPNALTAPIVGGSERVEHPTQKPLAVIEKLIEASSNPGDLVVDFMAGSGTTGVAAKRLRRRFLLVEREEHYVNITKTRLGTEPLELGRLFIGIDIDEAAVRETARRLSETTAAKDGPPTDGPPAPRLASDATAPAANVPSAIVASEPPSKSSEPLFVGVLPGPRGYAATIDSVGEVISCTPAPTTGETCDAEGVARLVKSWAEAGVAKVVVDEPAVDGLDKAASLRVRSDYGMWIKALTACRVFHEGTPFPWRDPECGWDEQFEAAKAFPGVDLRAVERSDHRVSREKASALLIARYAWKLHSTVLGQDGGGLAGFQPRRRRKPRASASCK